MCKSFEVPITETIKEPRIEAPIDRFIKIAGPIVKRLVTPPVEAVKTSNDFDIKQSNSGFKTV